MSRPGTPTNSDPRRGESTPPPEQEERAGSTPRILIVDDLDAIHDDFRKILAPETRNQELGDVEAVIFGEKASECPEFRFEIVSAFQGEQAVQIVRDAQQEGRPFSLAFVDMRMPPGIDGLETVIKMWEHDPDLQVVISSAYSDYTWAEIYNKLGHSDRFLLLRKPFDNAEVLQQACGLTAKWLLARQASLRMSELEQMVEERTRVLRGEISERRAAEAQLRHAATHDMLTGLVNRSHLIERIERCIDRRRREDGFEYAVLFLDCDDFKSINDSLGHEFGDELLKALAERLVGTLRKLDTVVRAEGDITARFGGDEFVVLLSGLKRSSDATDVAERITRHMAEPFVLRGTEVNTSVSLGIAIGADRHDTADELIQDADAAMYRAKSSGKAAHAVFDEHLFEHQVQRLKLENELRKALELGQFRLVYEPIVDLRSHSLIALEALLRWAHPTRGLLPPADFLQVAEDAGLLVPIGRWVLSEACAQLVEWRQSLDGVDHVCMTVNISKKQLRSPTFVPSLEQALEQSGLPGNRLTLDVTEEAVITDLDAAGETLLAAKQLGVQIHMDDFGTGLSSLSFLHKLPIDGVKIDRAFIAHLGAAREYDAIVFAVLALAKHLNKKVIAEGVESQEQVEQLLKLGCDFIQGYHVTKPVDSEHAARMLTGSFPWSSAA